ncbi:MAG: ArsR/SmtB family transcription factor [Longimicrobiales bacterium]
MSAALPVEIVREPERALALLDPERQRLVEALAAGPDSASGLARRLGEERQRLNYHLRVLENAGLVEEVLQHNKSNHRERVLRPVARRFVLDPSAAGGLGDIDPEDAGDRFSATYLVALAARTVREVAALSSRARRDRTRLASASINTSVRLKTPADYQSLVEDLTRAVADVVARHHDESGDGRWYRVIASAYPGPAPPDNSREASNAKVD